MQKYSDGRLIVTPLRLNGLRIKQNSFRQFTEQCKWNYILDNNSDEDHKSHRTLVLSSSSHCAALSLSHCTVWLLLCLSLRCRLVLSLSSHCTTLSLSNCAGWLLRRFSLPRHLALSSHRPLVLLSSSHCATLLSSCAGWLLCCLLLRRPLVLSWRCPLVLSFRAG